MIGSLTYQVNPTYQAARALVDPAASGLGLFESHGHSTIRAAIGKLTEERDLAVAVGEAESDDW